MREQATTRLDSNLQWRLLALDLDGTTLGRDHTISAANREWLLRAREAGLQFTFATGRHRLGLVSSYIEELAIEVPFVTVNGGEVWAAGGSLLKRTLLNPEDVDLLYGLTEEYDIRYWGATTQGPVSFDSFPKRSELRLYDWLKFGFWGPQTQVIQTLWQRLSELDRFELTNSDPSNIEVNPKHVTKATGLQVVCDVLQIEPREVIVMGDSLNDLSMFHWAGYPVAMGNAQQILKDAARDVTLDCEDDGVAAFLQRLLQG